MSLTALTLSSCSLFRTSETDGASPDGTTQTEAGTDVIPAPNPETASGDAVQPSEQPSDPPQVAAAPTEIEMPPEPPKVDDPVTPTPVEPTQEVAQTPPAPAEPPPAPVAAPVMAASAGSEDYKVQSGETLMKIAFEQYGDLYQWRKIFNANRDRIKDPNSVPPGTVLRLEKPSLPVAISRNGEKYLIKSGDTLGIISDDVYGTNRKWRKLWENNRQMIKDPNRIFAGFHLYYMMTDQDRVEKEQLKGQPEVKPMPLAQKGDFQFPNRAPASQ
ncbi:LysM peptidoglycan-binding domain-containing protein [Bdellovibrionota bacterium FG-2]